MEEEEGGGEELFLFVSLAQFLFFLFFSFFVIFKKIFIRIIMYNTDTGISTCQKIFQHSERVQFSSAQFGLVRFSSVRFGSVHKSVYA